MKKTCVNCGRDSKPALCQSCRDSLDNLPSTLDLEYQDGTKEHLVVDMPDSEDMARLAEFIRSGGMEKLCRDILKFDKE
ncbi:MAG: hypothetical protein ACXABY_07190 [Candidatus Thorarchaeota archaeon]|jgi:aryl-alcohol dehydrogenase-like predicted oxidoreductase